MQEITNDDFPSSHHYLRFDEFRVVLINHFHGGFVAVRRRTADVRAQPDKVVARILGLNRHMNHKITINWHYINNAIRKPLVMAV